MPSRRWTKLSLCIYRVQPTYRISIIMEERQAKQATSPVIDTSHKQKVENLPLLCVETIFKFTQTSKLTRLYSNEVPLPGAFWQFGLEAALKKRLPLSIDADPPHQYADDTSIHKADFPSAVFDASGALVASIRVPDAFSDSPLCDLIGSATQDFRLFTGPYAALLSSLPNIVKLTHWHYSCTGSCCLLTKLKHLLPHLQSLKVGFIRELRIHKMSSLQHLHIKQEAFKGVMQTAEDNPVSAVRKRTREVLSGLRSLNIWSGGRSYINDENPDDVDREMLRFLRVRCSHLSALYLSVDSQFKPYLAAFRALTGLTTLGMYLSDGLKGVIFSKDETINTVVDLRLLYARPTRSKVLSIASLFPAAKAITLQYFSSHHDVLDALDLASELCTKRALPQLAHLNCFITGAYSTSFSTQIIADPHLPETVDLSEIIFERLVREPSLLTAIYKAMQANSTTSLIMRGPFHREALTDLQRHIDSSRENAQVTAWKDRDLGEQPGVFSVEEISLQTDVTIVGHKTSGILVGEKFTIRIVHQLTKTRCIWWLETTLIKF